MWVGLLIFYVANVANVANVIKVHFAVCLPCLSIPKLPPNTAFPKTASSKSYAHRKTTSGSP